jgi:hypothetical protein
MLPFMRPIQLHQRPITLVRLFCLTLMLALLANPVLALVATSPGCDEQPCCYTDTVPEPPPKISGGTDKNSACCHPTGSMPCHVATDRLPDTPLALIQATQRDSAHGLHLLPSGANAAPTPQANHLSIVRIDNGTIIPTSPVYMQTCRFIC